MAPIRTSQQWTRLIRFIAVETSQVHIGQPVDPKLDVGLAAWNKQTIKAYEIVGSALDPAAQVTNTVLTVKELLAPLSREELKIVRCLGLNYSDHAVAPILFYKPLSSMIGPNAPIYVPKVAQPVEVHLSDYEVELTIVIGKTAKNVSEAEALDYVLGYTGANDTTPPPSDPASSPTTPFPDPQSLPLACTLNGKTLQNGNTKDQIFNIRQTIAFLSQATTLEPGSIILTGTPAGVGFARKPAIVLRHGDNCRVWIGHGIGTLVNPVVEEGKQAGAKL
ncbi:hypothetical protein J3R83DRAFT_1191 [Lanmaoa asiatica]|nr:hypothetical protein J3R83DRAFT_1191 [Lanmaoa asiatica]